ncbi:unannotated protein [freshwater metagenome]|uniref:Unannotated protein n=1 Tax=freshwater metagenome TaxID=449393 RepID=A0A6J6ENB8_9ZZZZ
METEPPIRRTPATGTSRGPWNTRAGPPPCSPHHTETMPMMAAATQMGTARVSRGIREARTKENTALNSNITPTAERARNKCCRTPDTPSPPKSPQSTMARIGMVGSSYGVTCSNWHGVPSVICGRPSMNFTVNESDMVPRINNATHPSNTITKPVMASRCRRRLASCGNQLLRRMEPRLFPPSFIIVDLASAIRPGDSNVDRRWARPARDGANDRHNTLRPRTPCTPRGVGGTARVRCCRRPPCRGRPAAVRTRR